MGNRAGSWGSARLRTLAHLVWLFRCRLVRCWILPRISRRFPCTAATNQPKDHRRYALRMHGLSRSRRARILAKSEDKEEKSSKLILFMSGLAETPSNVSHSSGWSRRYNRHWMPSNVLENDGLRYIRNRSASSHEIRCQKEVMPRLPATARWTVRNPFLHFFTRPIPEDPVPPCTLVPSHGTRRR